MADYTADVVVWGGTLSGVMAAKAAADAGRTVILVNQYWHGSAGLHIGGMSTGGLAQMDFGPNTPRSQIIGGYSRQLLEAMDVVFNKPEGTLMTNPLPANFAGAVSALRTTPGITTYFNKALDFVTKLNGVITKMTAVGGDTYSGSVFIDASYEGDLMYLAGVTCSIGREAADTTGELSEMDAVNFERWYRPGWENQLSAGATSVLDANGQRTPNTGPLPKASRREGDADPTLQSINFRLILTKTAGKRVAFFQPPGYQASHYEALKNYLLANTQIVKFQAAAGGSDNLLEGSLLATNSSDLTYDCNSPGTIGTDVNGHLWLDAGIYPFASIQRSFIEANYIQRRAMMTAVYRWVSGLVYFVANDASLAGTPLQTDAQLYGYTNTQFATGFFGQAYFPPQMYLREGRRMVGQYVMSVKDVLSGATKSDPVCKFNYRLDHHPAVRHANITNFSQQATEGSVQASVSPAQPYQIPWRALLPVQGQADNLIVSTCISCTHVAWGSLRLEPSIWMQGEAAGTAAALCLNNGFTPQTLPYGRLAQALVANGAKL